MEQRIRDDTLFDEKIKLVREAASVCYRQYHVNQEYKCRPIYTEYLRMIQHKNGIIHDHADFLVRPPWHDMRCNGSTGRTRAGRGSGEEENMASMSGHAAEADGAGRCSFHWCALCVCAGG